MLLVQGLSRLSPILTAALALKAQRVSLLIWPISDSLFKIVRKPSLFLCIAVVDPQLHGCPEHPDHDLQEVFHERTGLSY